jgi:hypothetical protein
MPAAKWWPQQEEGWNSTRPSVGRLVERRAGRPAAGEDRARRCRRCREGPADGPSCQTRSSSASHSKMPDGYARLSSLQQESRRRSRVSTGFRAGRLWHTGAVGRRSRKGSVGPAWSSSLGDGPRATAPSTPAWIPVTDGLPRMPTECRGVTGVDAAAAKVLLRRALSPTWSRTRSPTRVTPISFRWLMSSSRMTSPVMSFCSKTGARWPHLSEARNEATSWACHSSTGGSPSAAGDTANDGEAIG